MNILPFPEPEEPDDHEVIFRIARQAFKITLSAKVEEITGKKAEVLEFPENSGQPEEP